MDRQLRHAVLIELDLFRIGVVFAVELHRDPGLWAVEVEDVGPPKGAGDGT